MSETLTLPKIVISRDDFETLGNLAEIAAPDQKAAADLLQRELQRARIVAPEKLDPGVVRIGAFVCYRLGAGPERTVQLVLPYQADIAHNRISVLTPVGAALIGLSHGQAIRFTATDGRSQVLQVIRVSQTGDMS
ncbi:MULTISPECIES: nucleoside diphosphate kinase regulator [Asticcacaulis]|uniref:nucleoside diphosphate kinase regulator n=1 Tax=Asticcacaulis TaxID=76890 RepID=UPI001AE7FFF4|nr:MULTISPECIES: nucleoside diphosphate kinase regulator [Asticcacaulis]MBP2161892.1 regulator of nucleoside diphosphate kinase [Asticcacaulis solisilvae]MDR6802946.1 regulator of nucleoside diphosphate kinase [Asticcacaulis sp. BE141]